jgi:hypothetical protein
LVEIKKVEEKISYAASCLSCSFLSRPDMPCPGMPFACVSRSSVIEKRLCVMRTLCAV